MIHEDLFFRNPGGCCVILHAVDFVILFPAVVAAHEKRAHRTVPAETDAGQQAILQHMTRGSVRTHTRTEDENAVRVRIVCGFRRNNAVTDSITYMKIDRAYRKDGGEHENQQSFKNFSESVRSFHGIPVLPAAAPG